MHVDNERVVFEDDFSKDTRNRWIDDGSPSKIKDGQLATQEGALVILNEDIGEYLSVSVDARSDEDAGIIVNYQDKDNYLVGLCSSLENKMYFYEVIDGHRGEPLGAGRGPLTRGPRVLPKGIGKDITLTVTQQNGVATLEVKSDKGTHASNIEIGKPQSGKLGLWQSHWRAQQRYDNFTVKNIPNRKAGVRYLPDSTVYFERVPSPQDWVLVMEREQRLKNAARIKKAEL